TQHRNNNAYCQDNELFGSIGMTPYVLFTSTCRHGGSATPPRASRPATRPSGGAEDSGLPRLVPFHHSQPRCWDVTQGTDGARGPHSREEASSAEPCNASWSQVIQRGVCGGGRGHGAELGALRRGHLPRRARAAE